MFATQQGVKNHVTRMVLAAPAAEPALYGALARDRSCGPQAGRCGQLPLAVPGVSAALRRRRRHQRPGLAARGPSDWWRKKCAGQGLTRGRTMSLFKGLTGPDLPAGQGWGSDLGQTDEEDDPGECMVCKKNEQYPIK